MLSQTIRFRIADLNYVTLLNTEAVFTQNFDQGGETMTLNTFSERDFELWCSELKAAGCKFEKVTPA